MWKIEHKCSFFCCIVGEKNANKRKWREKLNKAKQEHFSKMEVGKKFHFMAEFLWVVYNHDNVDINLVRDWTSDSEGRLEVVGKNKKGGICSTIFSIVVLVEKSVINLDNLNKKLCCVDRMSFKDIHNHIKRMQWK